VHALFLQNQKLGKQRTTKSQFLRDEPTMAMAVTAQSTNQPEKT
jgi:hypothetical protein